MLAKPLDSLSGPVERVPALAVPRATAPEPSSCKRRRIKPTTRQQQPRLPSDLNLPTSCNLLDRVLGTGNPATRCYGSTTALPLVPGPVGRKILSAGRQLPQSAAI